MQPKFYQAVEAQYKGIVPIGFLKSWHVFPRDQKTDDTDTGKIFEGSDGSEWQYIGIKKAIVSNKPAKHFKLIQKPNSKN